MSPVVVRYKPIKGNKDWAMKGCETTCFNRERERKVRFKPRDNGYSPLFPNWVYAHLCANPRCSNPEHIAAITQGQNLLMGDVTKNGSITQYKCCHPRTIGNSYFKKDGRSQCKTCLLEKQKLRKGVNKNASCG